MAVIQAEDKRFYDHPGVDYKSMGAAVIKGLTSESLRGASTITMQLASLLDRELQPKKERKSFWQKGRQILEAWEIEKSWSKRRSWRPTSTSSHFGENFKGLPQPQEGYLEKILMAWTDQNPSSWPP